MRFFCTYFDHNYLPRGLALYHSLQRHCPQSQLFVLCLTPECHDVMTRLNLPNLRLARLEEMEAGDEPLRQAKTNRSLVEYYFTCTATFILYALKQCPEAQAITYLDSDMLFFDDPESVFREIADRSIAIVPHRFAPEMSRLLNAGIYNVSWVYFRRDDVGMACLNWWRERCLEWCYDIMEEERYADQKYLNRWPEMFKSLAVIAHKGVNAAPFNIGGNRIRSQGGKVWVDEDPLVIFHFHGLRQINRCLFDPNFALYNTAGCRAVRRDIYGPYIRALHEARNQAAAYLPKAQLCVTPRLKPAPKPQLNLDPARHIVNEMRIIMQKLRAVWDGQTLVYFGGRVW